jgi:hypothetical protein
MKELENILGDCLAEQVALEERLYKEVEYQLSQVKESEFSDVKELLSNIQTVLDTHFERLNKVLDKLDNPTFTGNDCENGHDCKNGGNCEYNMNSFSQATNSTKNGQISRMLRNDYSALNLIAMGNTLLHTTALAADYSEVADLVLEHLENLTPLVIRMNDLTPKVVARELSQRFPKVALTVGDTAARNARQAWKVWRN